MIALLRNAIIILLIFNLYYKNLKRAQYPRRNYSDSDLFTLLARIKQSLLIVSRAYW